MPRLFHHSLTFQVHVFPKKLRGLFLGHFVRGAAQNMAGLFVPLFLFTQAEQIGLQRWLPALQADKVLDSLTTVCVFYILSRVVACALAIPLTKLMKKTGLVKSMLLGNVCLVGTYLALLASITNPYWFGVAAVFAGLEVVFYWIPFYTEFAVYSDTKALPKEMSLLVFLERAGRALVPMLGGALIAVFGFEGLYLFSVCSLLLSAVFLLMVPEVRFLHNASWREFGQWLKDGLYRKMALGMGGRAWEDYGLTLWPIYLLLFVGTVERVGYLYGLVLLTSLLFSVVVIWVLGRRRGRRLFLWSASVLSLLWIVRGLASQIWQLVSVDIVQRLADSLYIPGFDVHLFRHARRERLLQFFTYREVIVSLGAILFWSTALVFFWTPIGWKGVFGLAACGVLFSMLVAARTIPLHGKQV